MESARKLYRKTFGLKINGLSDKIWQIIHRKSYINDTILVFGVGRSGTTLLMEILYTLPRYRIIFEPLHPGWSVDKVLGGNLELFPYHDLYRRIDEKDQRLEKYIRKILSGTVSLESPTGAKTKSEVIVRIIKKLLANKVLVKFIRANKIIHWIARNFDVKGIYLIIRHPGATIASQIKMGWYPRNTESIKFSKNAIKAVLYRSVELQDKQEELIKLIDRIEKPEEVMAAWWALDYSIPLYYKNKGFYLLVYYEHLIKNYKYELKKIFSFISERVPQRAYKIIKRPTSTSSSKTIRISEQLNKWKKVLDPSKRERIFKVIEKFDLNIYEISEDEPVSMN